MIELVGIEAFLYRLNESVKGRKLNPKYKDLINRSKTKYDENTDGILEFLRVRGAL